MKKRSVVRHPVKRKSSKKYFLFKSSSVPSFVKVIALLYYIVAVLTIFTGFVLFVDGIGGGNWRGSLGIDNVLGSMSQGSPIDKWFVENVLSYVLIGGFVLVLIGLFEVFIGNSLLKAKKWARILTIVFMVISFISALAYLDLASMIISVLIGSYLLFNRDVIRVMRK